MSVKFINHGRLGRWTVAMAARHHGAPAKRETVAAADRDMRDPTSRSSAPDCRASNRTDTR